jgi:hypothetical protein
MLPLRVTISPMIARDQRTETAAAHESLVSETSSREAPMIAQRADCRVPQHDSTGRRLRNRIIVVNVIAWMAIIALMRLIFF